ncbi:radical SAM protein [Desulfovibrio sp. OttesenSCG-928-C14]|nr:radical SAM protein [Desulfovibrio sp. OttesenSCG-928-C14]
MEIERAKTLALMQTRELSEARIRNSEANRAQALAGDIICDSLPRRIVFELTSACNLSCVTCGRNAANFKATYFNPDWLSFFESSVDRIEEVTLMGWGEPTVHPEFVNFLDFARSNGLRKYFCTNGMRLKNLHGDIFKHEVDIIAVSLDGPDQDSNSRIRRGSDFTRITESIKEIVKTRGQRGLQYPYINFVFTAMRSNIRKLPSMVTLAAQLGIEEVKCVFFTAFTEKLKKESLFSSQNLVRETFEQTAELAERYGIILKLPHLPGEDPAGEQAHKTCYTAWRDVFIGSDGYFRPCMSTAQKLFSIDRYPSLEESWNGPEYQAFRATVNTAAMNSSCLHCYHSSFANWNKEDSFMQTGNVFAPTW